MGRQRRTGWEERFLKALRETGNVRWACERAHVYPDLVYKQRGEDPRFREAWDKAILARQGQPQSRRWKGGLSVHTEP